MSELVKYSEQTFESIKHVNEYGEEYWLARELQPVLEYAQWRRFSDAIERAKLACKNSGFAVEDHFADVGKMVDIGSGAERQIDDVMLSRPSRNWAVRCRKICRHPRRVLLRSSESREHGN